MPASPQRSSSTRRGSKASTQRRLLLPPATLQALPTVTRGGWLKDPIVALVVPSATDKLPGVTRPGLFPRGRFPCNAADPSPDAGDHFGGTNGEDPFARCAERQRKRSCHSTYSSWLRGDNSLLTTGKLSGADVRSVLRASVKRPLADWYPKRLC